MPRASIGRINLFLPYFNAYMPRYGIATRLRMAAFLATVAHESGSLVYTREIASGKAYEGRKDLGNVFKGDGVRFRGRGLIQLTGRANYTEMTKDFSIDVVHNPTLVEMPELAVRSACWFWWKRGLNKVADTGDMVAVTRIVNGGKNGLDDRLQYYKRALQVLP